MTTLHKLLPTFLVAILIFFTSCSKDDDNTQTNNYTTVESLLNEIIFQGYALNAMEAMASGLPVLGNLEDSNIIRLFNRYSFLSECPASFNFFSIN